MRYGHRRPLKAHPASVLTLLLLTALVPGQVVAQTTQPDASGPLFDARDAWIAGAYFAGAALAFPFDEPVAAEVRDSVLQETPGLKEGARAFNLLGFPGSLLISGGLYGAGRIFDEPAMADVGLHVTEAIVLAEAVTYLLKVTAGRARPAEGIDNSWDFELFRGLESDDYQSFPSGHATAAFATAAALAHEMERLWGGSDVLYGVATYGPAAMVALARMFDNRHWASDVIFGAAIGAFSGWKIVQYNHDNPGNRVDDWFLTATVSPGDWGVRIGLSPAFSGAMH